MQKNIEVRSVGGQIASKVFQKVIERGSSVGSYFLLIGKRMVGIFQLQDYPLEHSFSSLSGNALSW